LEVFPAFEQFGGHFALKDADLDADGVLDRFDALEDFSGPCD
jgi:hypothetical protein